MHKNVFFLSLSFLINLYAYAQCNVDDYKALRALYLATNGDSWKNKENWDVKSANPPSNCNLLKFNGVYLNEMGRVNLISLGQNNLTGKLPVEIKDLKYLNTLWLNQNAITGTIPKEIGELQLLERLALSYNQFEGRFPQELFSIKSIKELSLETNKLEGSIPSIIGNLLNLKRLDLSNNNLSGSLPKEIGELKLLDNINVSNNNFEGCFPLSFQSLCTKISNFTGNIQLANWQSFCKTPSECKFEYKEVSFEIDTLYVSQSPKKKQFIFISEGFTKDEFPKFRSFVIKMTSKLKEHFPNISFEALLAYVPSNQSGVSNTKANPSIIKDTYFETDLVPNVFGSPSVSIKENIAAPFIRRYFPENKYPLSSRIISYVVNSDIYGAYASAVEGAYTNKTIGLEINIGTLQDAEWVFAHELGHFFGLADIQDAHVTPQGEWANATRETDRNKIRWKQYIKNSIPIPTPKNSGYDNEMGLFSVTDKDGKPTGWYRPCNNDCIMRTPSSHGNFCTVCGGHLNRNDNLPFVVVENGKFGGYYYAGNRVTIQANIPEQSVVFSHWEGDGVAFENISNSKTSFVMPNNNITVKAVFKPIVLSTNLLLLNEQIQIVKVYPNPSEGEFWLNVPSDFGDSQVEVSDISGRQVFTKKLQSQKERINMNVASGIYLLKVFNGERAETLKCIIVK